MKHSNRISLCTVKNGRPWSSFCEGEYVQGGLKAAIADAERSAKTASQWCVEDQIGVMVFSIAPRWRAASNQEFHCFTLN